MESLSVPSGPLSREGNPYPNRQTACEASGPKHAGVNQGRRPRCGPSAAATADLPRGGAAPAESARNGALLS